MTVFVFFFFGGGGLRSGFHGFRLFKLRFGLDIAAAGVAIVAAVAVAAAAMAASIALATLNPKQTSSASSSLRALQPSRQRPSGLL